AINVVMDTDKTLTATFAIDTTLAPRFVSITDVPLDQGGRVKLRWLASSLETPGADPQNLVTQYFVWREIPQSAFIAAARAAAANAATAPAAATEGVPATFRTSAAT